MHDPNIRKGRRTSFETQLRIWKLLDAGFKHREIARMTGVSPGTVSRERQKWKRNEEERRRS